MAVSLVAFSLYGTLLDVTSLEECVRKYTPMSEQLIETWRARQIQLANLATTTGRYVDLDRITLMALHEIAPRYHLKLTPHDSKVLLDAWTELHPFPDVQFAIDAAVRRNLRPIICTNAVESTARNAMTYAKIGGSFDTVISANDAHVYKPNGAVYQLIVQRCGVTPESVVFVSSYDWDVSGARRAGFNTVWVQRGRTGQGRPERTVDDFSQLGALLDRIIAGS